MAQQKSLDVHQQELVNVVKAAHRTLAVARKTRTTELARRVAEDKIRLQREAEKSEYRIKLELDAEVGQHETNLDEALIAAYTNGVPIRRIALDGFGNRYDGAVQALLVKLRADGRLGSRDGYQRNTEDRTPTVSFPKPVDVDSIISESTTVSEPTFTFRPEPLVLVPAGADGDDGVSVPAVTLALDSRDPWFDSIRSNARPGTPYLHATEVTLYEHPFSGVLMTWESKESGDTIWDHPVARWVKEHPDEALAGFRAAQLKDLANAAPAVTVDDLKQVAALGEQLGIRGPEATK